MRDSESDMLSASMRPQEYERIREILSDLRPEHTLEIGMANGGSSVVICNALRTLGRGRHTAIDPFQSSAQGWLGKGIEAVCQADLASYCEVIEDYDYLALPQLVAEHRQYDFILIDGWHSFDYTLLNLFYADFLLCCGGVLAVHDTGLPAVHKACKFLESHKQYQRIGPPISVGLKSLPKRITRRVLQLFSGPHQMKEAKCRREKWFSLGAYRKVQDHQVGNEFFANF